MTGSPILMIWNKWPSRPHWSVATTLLKRQGEGMWLGTKAGTPIIRPPDRQPAVASGDSVLLCTPERHWVARWYRATGRAGRAARFSCYVDITTPPLVRDEEVVVVDLDLDVGVTWDGMVVVLDEDEFLSHAAAYGYPEWLQRNARKACEEVQALLADRAPPFDGRHQEMLRGPHAALGED